MSKNNDLFSLPAGPTALCFDKNEFMKKTFTVDEFLHEHRNCGSLEIMRDDLGIYLKVLRSAMIELINEDYADFVNLSSNLVGLDNSINNIQRPLELLREEVNSVKLALKDNIDEIQLCLNQKKYLRNYKRNLKSLAKVKNAMSKLEDLLEVQLSGDGIKPFVLERAALELIQLNFHKKFCDDFLNSKQKEKSENLHKGLLEKLKMYFFDALKSNKNDNLERCLRIYATLDEFREAERIFKNEIVGVYMNDRISEVALQNSAQNLVGIYNKILEFISLKMNNLLFLTHHTDKVKGFNFILNSFWVEVERRLESHMSSIFAPGNPDSFYSKYKNTLEFLERIESTISNDNMIKIFRSHPSSKKFQSKWNLPVYFQIRFQEIAGTIETVCNQSLNEKIIDNNNEFAIVTFQTAINTVLKCWSDGVYIPKLFQKFWKLSLQIIARLMCWIKDTLCSINKPSSDIKLNKMDILVHIYSDSVKLLKKFQEILKLVEMKMPLDVRPHFLLLKKCLDASEEQLMFEMRNVENNIVTEVVTRSLTSIRQVSDIPRLYRKTNRDIPSKQCSYVEQMLEPLKVFRDQFDKHIDSEKMAQLTIEVFSKITVQYFNAIMEVLTSVQKTEESLRRLKNLRERNVSASQTTGDRQMMSDDDKIRLQLQVDAKYWATEIEQIEKTRSKIEKLDDLIILIDDATKIKNSDK